jgi:hypothetical protein
VPVTAEKVPITHGVHNPALAAENRPAAQLMHEEEAAAEYWPAVHAAHAAAKDAPAVAE